MCLHQGPLSVRMQPSGLRASGSNDTADLALSLGCDDQSDCVVLPVCALEQPDSPPQVRNGVSDRHEFMNSQHHLVDEAST